MSAAQWVMLTTPNVCVCEETAGEMLTSGLKPKMPYPLSSLQKWQYTMYRLLNDSSVSFAVTLFSVFVLWVCSACNSSHATLCLLIVCVSAVPVCWRFVCVCVCVCVCVSCGLCLGSLYGSMAHLTLGWSGFFLQKTLLCLRIAWLLEF